MNSLTSQTTLYESVSFPYDPRNNVLTLKGFPTTNIAIKPSLRPRRVRVVWRHRTGNGIVRTPFVSRSRTSRKLPSPKEELAVAPCGRSSVALSRFVRLFSPIGRSMSDRPHKPHEQPSARFNNDALRREIHVALMRWPSVWRDVGGVRMGGCPFCCS